MLNAEVILDGLDDVVHKGDILASGVGPALVEAVGGDEDGAVVAGHQGREAVVSQGAPLAVGNLRGAAAKSVEGEDKAVGRVAVVVVWQTHDVLPLLAVNGHGVLTITDRGGLAAAG